MLRFGINVQHACFDCRKVFKKPRYYVRWHRFMSGDQLAGAERESERAQGLVYLCPQCRSPMTFMGMEFKAPKTTDVRGWDKARAASILAKRR